MSYPKPYITLPFVPGPTTLEPTIFTALNQDYGSGQIEAEFLPTYARTCALLQPIFGTTNDIVLMTGEGMLALWGSLKSCLVKGDTVLCIGTGVFGDGFVPMAQSIGCVAHHLAFDHNSTINTPQALERIEAAIKQHKPKMITLVHCETPSGTCNPLEQVGALKKQYGVPLFCVDAVASAGGEAVNTDACNIDLLMVGSQKCLSAPPSMSIVAVSPTAWDIMRQVQYQGYDAILPFATIMQDGRCPYTPYWHGVAALEAAALAIHQEGIEATFARHTEVAQLCRTGLERLGIQLFPAPTAQPAQTVTAAYIPAQYSWTEWYSRLHQKGLATAGSFGEMQGKVFRLGHMGVQANHKKMEDALAVIASCL